MLRSKLLTFEALYVIFLLAYKDATAVFNSTTFETTEVNNELKVIVYFANITGTALCINDLGDGIAALTNLPNTSSPWTYTYQYMVPNFYDVYIICHTEHILAADNKTLYLGDAIMGLDVTNGTGKHFVGITYPAENVTLNLFVGKGSNLTFHISYMNTFEGKNGSNFVSFDSNLPGLGLHMINITVSNPLNNISDFLLVDIEEPIQAFDLLSYSRCKYVETKINFTLDFTLGLGSDVSFVLNEMNASNITQGIAAQHCSGKVRNSSISYALQETGIYYLEIETTNYINVLNPIKTFLQIRAVRAVNNITYTIGNPIHFYNETMRYTLAVDGSALVPMGPISCNVTFGNGDFTITWFNLDVTNLSAVAIDGNSSSLPSTEKNFTYGLAGFYNSVANCTIDPSLVNCPSSIGQLDKYYIQVNRSVVVENPVKNIHLLNESDYIPLSTGSAVISVVLDSENDLPLANITCVFNFGGETNTSMVGNVDAASNITAEYQFSTVGIFKIYVTCFNHLSYMDLNLIVEVYVDCFKIPYFFDKPFKNINTPLWTYVTDLLEVAAVVETTDLCRNETPVYKWNIYNDISETAECNLSLALPTKSVLTFPAETVGPHTQPYKVVLNASYSFGASLRDYIYVDFRLPNLVARIDGGSTLTVHYSSEKTSTLNASSSHDPVTKLTAINTISLNSSWRCYFLDQATDSDVLAYLTQISSSSLLISNDTEDLNLNETDFPGVKQKCSITDRSASSKVVTFTNTDLSLNVWTLFVFKITRNSVFNITRNRVSIAVQAMKAVPEEIVPLVINMTSGKEGYTINHGPGEHNTVHQGFAESMHALVQAASYRRYNLLSALFPGELLVHVHRLYRMSKHEGFYFSGLKEEAESEFYARKNPDDGYDWFHLHAKVYLKFAHERCRFVVQHDLKSRGFPRRTPAIRCVYNCRFSYKIAHDDVQLEMETTNNDLDSLVPKGVSFRWEVSQWDAVLKVYVNITGSLITTTGLESKGIFISKKSFVTGKKYLITAHINIPSTAQRGTVTNIWSVNEPPYGGTCTLNNTKVNATFEKIKYKCSGWKDEEERDKQDPVIDVNPRLTFYINQDNNYTDNDPPKLLMNTGQMEAFVVLFLGNPNDDFNTIFIIRVVDMFGNYAEVSFVIQSMPYNELDSDSNLTFALEDFLQKFNTTLTENMEQGNIQAIINLCLSSASQMITQNFVKPPLVESSLYGPNLGGLLGNKSNSTQSLETWMANYAGEDILSPEIAAGQKAIQFIAQAILLNAANSNSSLKNPMKIIQISNAFETLLSDEILANNATKNLACDALEKVKEGLDTLKLDKPNALEAVEAIMAFMGKTVASISPNFDGDRTLVTSVDEARAYLQAMISIFGDDRMMSEIENSPMSPDEMTFVNLKTQLKLSYNVEKEFINVGRIQDLVENITSIINKNLNLVSGITSSFGTDIIKHEVRVEHTDNITAARLSVLSTNITLNAIKGDYNAIEGDYGGKLRISLTSTKPLKSVYKNDPDGNSRFLTSETAHFDIQQPVKASITFRQSVQTPKPRLISPQKYSEDASGFISYIKYFARSSFDNFCTLLKPMDDRIVAYKVYISRISNPTLNSYDVQVEATDYNDWQVCVQSSRLQGHTGVTYLAIKAETRDPPLKRRTRRDVVNNSTLAANGADATAIDENMNCSRRGAETCPFELSMITATCMTWNEEKISWQDKGCDMTWNAREGYIECNCNEIKQRTLTFGNTFYVPPNAIDFSTVFLKFSPLNQAAVIATLVIIFITYIIVIIWARWQDRRDILKWGIAPLADNFSDDNYFYLLKVYTGVRPGAGTKSRIGFVIAGDLADTGVRELSDGVRKEFKTGTIMNFLLSVPEHIGAIQYLRIWHDNSGGGESASWYLSKIEIYDIQKNEGFTFMAQQWLSVENGQTECIIPVTCTEDLSTFKNRFYSHAKTSLSDSHLWISVFYRPTTSNFTRVQRASCVLVFIMLNMISSAMYYNPGDNYQTADGFKFGPVRFTLQQIYVSLVCALITTPATMVVITLFKNSRRRYSKKNKFLNKSDKSTKYRIPFMESWFEKRQQESLDLEKHLIVKGLPRFEGCWLPSWSVYIAWVLVVLSTVLPAFITLLFSMQWGKEKSEEWLTAFLLSFFESIFCLDPFKVLLTAVSLALLVRVLKESEMPFDRAAVLRGYTRGTIKHKGVRRPAPPLNKESLHNAQELRNKELRIKGALQGIILNLVYLWILFSISFSNRDNRSYNLREDIENRILAPKDLPKIFPKFLDIDSKESFFKWLNQTALPNLFPERDPNGKRLHWREREFINGFSSYRLGPPRLRQLRVKEAENLIPTLGKFTVFETYDIPTEVTENYCIGWRNLIKCPPLEEVNRFSSEAWKYTRAIDIWGYPLAGEYNTYSGGGYIAQLAVNLDVSRHILNELWNQSWIDRGTRVVLFEFTLYCANLNLFTYSVFMVEFPETGGAFPSYSILPLRVYQHVGSLGIYTLACEVLYLLYFIAFGILLIYRFHKQRLGFFKNNWQVVDLVAFIIRAVAIGIYIVRMVMTNLTITRFKEDPKRFVNFQHIALWDQVLVFLTGLLVFIATTSFLKILGHNKRVQSMFMVFANAGKDLMWFCIFLTYVILAYAVAGNLIFGSRLDSYKNLYSTLGTLFISIIGLSRFTDLEETDPVFSKIYFLVYIFSVVYLIMTMTLAILNQSIEAVHRETKEEHSEELVQYLLTKLRGILVFSSTLPDKKKDNADISEFSKTPWSQPVSYIDSSLLVSKEQGPIEMDTKSVIQEIRDTLSTELTRSKTGFQQRKMVCVRT